MKSKIDVTVGDSMGKIVDAHNIFWKDEDLILDMEGFSSGIYFIEIKVNSKTDIFKALLIKQVNVLQAEKIKNFFFKS